MSFKLSVELTGHTNDVRVVSSCALNDNEAIITASRDGTARMWNKINVLEYEVAKILTGHNGPVTAVCVLPPDVAAGRDNTHIVTGGQDAKIIMHDINLDEPVKILTGHQKYISSITYFAGLLISVSWDCTLRVWDDAQRHTECHKPAAYVVCGVPGPEPSFVLTGGADKLIKLWQLSSLSCVQEYRGHHDVVRDIKVLSPEQFLSAANDSTIRQWSIHTAACVSVYSGHEAYIYSISVFSGAGDIRFLSSGEDKTVRIWRGSSCEQTIQLPAQSVWSVYYLENGDFVVGSSDHKARVFSADQTRQASAEQQAIFDQEVEEQQKSAAAYESIDASRLPGKDILQQPGRQGETKLVQVDGKAEVYQWNEAETRWDKIGDALGQAPTPRHQRAMYQGQEYDYVFDIELDDGTPGQRKLKLPYNQTDDPWLAAHKFLDDNMLSQIYLDQVVQFIMKNTGAMPSSMPAVVAGSDPLTGPSRYIPESSGPAPPTVPTTYHSQQPPQHAITAMASTTYFPMDSYKTFVSPDDYHRKVVQKLREFNEAVDQAYQLNGGDMACLSGLCKDILLPHWDAVSPSHQTVVNKVLSWPPEYCFPGLDVLRLLVLKSTGSRCLLSDELSCQQFLQTMEDFLCGAKAQEKNQMAVLRMLANLFATKHGEELMIKNFDWVNVRLEGVYKSGNRTCQIALATVLLNYCHCCANNVSSSSEDVYSSLTINTYRVIQLSFDNEAKYRVLIGIGILVQSNVAACQMLNAPDVITTIKGLTTTLNHAKLAECATAVIKEIEKSTHS